VLKKLHNKEIQVFQEQETQPELASSL